MIAEGTDEGQRREGMNRCVGTLTALLCCFALVSTPAFPAESERERIAKVIDDSIGWFKTKDFELLFSTIADDPDFFMFQPGSTGTIHGIEQFRALSAIWKDPDTSYTRHEIRDLRIRLSGSGDVAWFSAILDDCGVYKGEAGCWMDARWTGVLEKGEDGWAIVQMHFSFAADKVREEIERRQGSPAAEP
jgi:ketosteroid isomerase-like protein